MTIKSAWKIGAFYLLIFTFGLVLKHIPVFSDITAMRRINAGKVKKV